MSATTVPELIPPPGVEQMPLNAIDRHFARFLIELNGAPSAELEFAAQMASAWREAGHVCVPLRSLGLSGIAGALRNSRVVGRPSQMLPLILDSNDRLYLHRYWEYEHRLASILSERLRSKPAFDQSLLSRGLERFYGRDEQAHEQRRAAEIAVQNNFCIITGGPGTGKTRTILVIVALLAEQFAERQIPFRVELAAPTGKAAARMKEALESTAVALQIDAATRATLPVDAKTVHRLLGPISSSPYFRHDRKRPLATDLVIVDEASMVDLALMTKLLDALPKEARLILLGDKDQLASVEAGYVLGDISQAASESGPEAPLHGRVVELRTNFRFRSESGIHRLASAVNEGNIADAVDLLQRQRHSDIRATPLPATAGLFEAIRNRVARLPDGAEHGEDPAVLTSGYAAYRQTADPVVALQRFGQFRILAALRRGPYGIENLNRLVEESLAAEGLIRPESAIFYSGRPVLVLRNDPQLKLYNGDVGLILPDSEADGALRAFFLDARGVLRRFLPARLPEHETAFAMTVHKAQGSEFDRVLLVLPAKESPVLTRELIYTGVTRAKGEVEIWYAEEPLRIGLARRIARSSGLRALLGGKESDAPFTTEGARGAGRPVDARSSERPTGRMPEAPAAQLAIQTEFWQ